MKYLISVLDWSSESPYHKDLIVVNIGLALRKEQTDDLLYPQKVNT